MANFRFEAQDDEILLINADTQQQAGEIAFMTADETLIIVHTGVNPEYRGQGLAEQLVLKVVEKARREDKKILPICPFAQKEFREKPDYSDVLRQDV
ncbi:MAG: N-acetyltransferase [Streptococcaceae bacterium]|jgi:predicted GNAT family acetyltransferase|nr:N-acetyltransferase [Streptococcaceae bacterium]